MVIKDALLSFKGTRRRIEMKSLIGGVLFLDDYAHHPTEIRATLETVKGLGYRRIIAIFQPHRFSRTKLLLEEFSHSFDLADLVVITDIYPADEKPIEGISGKSIFEKIRLYGKSPWVEFLSKDEIVPYILDIIKEGDLVITLGAGDIYIVADELVQRFKEQNKN
ncbi:MAG: UDP-N-acetylmuramate--L-alanine ligase, partial [Candidatus Omnitrophica bacterium]|nr:UDP-N-acetylmuramate--L-alanine ligase [Candidatus Omnitrophota bacterium]